MVIDDGTGEVEIYADALAEIGTLVRIIGRIFKNDAMRLCIDTEIIQDFSGFDMPLYQKVRLLEGEQ
jgi:hypothetical protein